MLNVMLRGRPNVENSHVRFDVWQVILANLMRVLLLSKLYFAVMVLLLAVCVHADMVTIDGRTWSYTGVVGGVRIDSVSGTIGTQIEIPTLLGGRSVVEIGDSVFDGKSQVVSLTIPDSVVRIGRMSFYKCSGLTSVILPNALKRVDDFAFSGCSNLKTVSHVGSDAEFGNLVFEQCYKLETVSLGASVIGAEDFSGCPLLTSLQLREGVTQICEKAFYKCSGLREVSLPASLVKIGSRAFEGCANIRSGVFPPNFPMSEVLPDSYKYVTSVNIPAGAKAISDEAFYGCANLTSVMIPASVRTIGGCAFQACTSLESISLPADLADVGSRAFYCCSKLSSVTLPVTVQKIGTWAFAGCEKLVEISVPEGVEDVGWSTFSMCYSLKSVVLPSSLKTIGVDAFSVCRSLASVSIPTGVTLIESGAFRSCALASLEIPASVERIGNGAFSGNVMKHVKFLGRPPEGLLTAGINTSATIQYDLAYADEWVPVLAQGGFSNVMADNLQTLPNGGPYSETADGMEWRFYIKDGKAEITSGLWGTPAISDATTGSIKVPQALGGCPVASIGDYAFWKCGGIHNILLPESVRRIGSGAFWECSRLKEIDIPDAVNDIGDCAFLHCSGLQNVVIPQGVTKIGWGTFDGCENLLSVEMPDDVDSIGDSAFKTCYSLRSIRLPENLRRIDEWAFSWCTNLVGIVIPPTVEEIGEGAFRECASLESIELPMGIKSIPRTGFSDCTSLTNVVLPSTVGDIGINAFASCRSLKQVNIPDAVTNIAQMAFFYCDSLEAVSLPMGLQSIGNSAFVGCRLKSVGIPKRLLGKVNGVFPYGCKLMEITPVEVQGRTVVEKYDGLPKYSSWSYSPDVGCAYKGVWSATDVGDYAVSATADDFSCDNDEIVPRYAILSESRVSILRRNVNIKTASAVKAYDGFSLWKGELEVSGDGFVNGECAPLAPFSLLNVGVETNCVFLEWSETANPSNYNLTVDEGILEILPRPVTLRSADITHVYDGQTVASPHVQVLGDGFVRNECVATSLVSRTSVGSSKNTITLNWASGALTTNYAITMQEGILTVLPANVSPNGEEPWGGDGPRPYVGGEGVHSLYSTCCTYDGKGHTIDIETLAKIKLVGGDEPQISYSLTSNGVYRSEPIYFTNSPLRCFVKNAS